MNPLFSLVRLLLRRPVAGVGGNVKVMALAAAMGIGGYAATFDRASRIDALGEGAGAVLLGKVVAAEAYDDAGAAAYLIGDPTGQAWVVTSRGAPAVGSIQCVMLRKELVSPGTDEPRDATGQRYVCVERRRCGGF